MGLYESYMKEGQFSEAYEVAKKIANFYPANPQRLGRIIRLAIQTEHFHDMQFYYEIFNSLEEDHPELKKYIGAGLFISGKHGLLNQDFSTAIQYFDQLSLSCSDMTKFTRAMVTILLKYDQPLEAQKYFSSFPDSSTGDEDYLVSEYIMKAKSASDDYIIGRGLDLYQSNIRDEYCLEILIAAMERKGFPSTKIQQLQKELTDFHLQPS
jgi:tetratricopeptide (TPR) repeat protein